MPVTSTQPLSVKSVNYIASGSVKLYITLSQPLVGPMLLSTITISKKDSGPPITGTIVPADATHPVGKVYIDMDGPTFADTRAQANVPCKVVIGYDTTTYAVVQLEILREVAAHAGAVTQPSNGTPPP